MRSVVVAVLVVFASLAPAPAQSPSDDASIGLWPWLVGNVDSSVPSVIAQALAADQDRIYVHIWRTTGSASGTLHIRDEALSWNPAHGAIDPDLTLTNLIRRAHAADLQVIGVVNCFLSGGPLPGDTTHEDRLIEVVDYIANTFDATGAPVYALDGIALDRIRYYSGTNNSPATVEAFIGRVRSTIGRMPLHAFIPANLWHIDGPTYDGNFRSYSESRGLLRGQYGHDWENLATLLDVMMPMAYIADGGLYGSNHARMQSYLQTVATYATMAVSLSGATGVRVVPAVRAWNDSGGTTSSASLGASITGALLGGADGAMVFRYFSAAGQSSWWSAIGNHAEAGQQHPLAGLSWSSTGNVTSLDASSSSSQGFPGQLLYRWDTDDDGVFDSGWSGVAQTSFAGAGTMPFTVAVEVMDPLGRRAVRRVEVTPAPNVLSFDIQSGYVSAASGGVNTINLSAGPSAAGDGYVIVGSASGTIPGTPISPTLNLALNWDAITDLTLSPAGAGLFQNFQGTLDASGSQTASIVVPAGLIPPSLAFHYLFFAAVGVDGSNPPQFTFVTDPATVFILP